MLRDARHVFPLALCALLMMGAVTAPNQKSASGTAAQLFRLSGLDHQLGTLADGVDAELMRLSAQVPETTLASLRRASRSAYEPAQLRNVARAHLESRLETGPVETVLRWLETEPVRRIVRLEEAASAPAAREEMLAWVERMPEPQEARLALVRQLDTATRATERTTEVALRVAGSVARGLLAAQGAATPASTSRVEAMLEAQRPAMHAAAEQSTLLSLLYTYRELSDAELGAYVRFLESEPGQWYQEVAAAALLRALDHAADRLERNLAGEAKPPVPAGLGRDVGPGPAGAAGR